VLLCYVCLEYSRSRCFSWYQNIDIDRSNFEISRLEVYGILYIIFLRFLLCILLQSTKISSKSIFMLWDGNTRLTYAIYTRCGWTRYTKVHVLKLKELHDNDNQITRLINSRFKFRKSQDLEDLNLEISRSQSRKILKSGMPYARILTILRSIFLWSIPCIEQM
jgi:hypothetical protein